MVSFTGLSPKQAQAIEALKAHFSTRCRSRGHPV